MDKKQSEYELRKISEGVFDKSTLMALYALAKKNCISELRGIVSTGKEANVYHGVAKDREIAVKIYCIETSSFKTMEKYIVGDRRFGSFKNRRHLIFAWAQKEYCNLKRLHGKILCPEAYSIEKNVLVMEFLGEDGKSAPRLKDQPPEDAQTYYHEVLDTVKKIYGEGLVHGDLSEYNILNYRGHPYFIDFSAGVLLDHPASDEFLRRDLSNVISYFKRQGVEEAKKADVEETIKWIKKT